MDTASSLIKKEKLNGQFTLLINQSSKIYASRVTTNQTKTSEGLMQNAFGAGWKRKRKSVTVHPGKSRRVRNPMPR